MSSQPNQSLIDGLACLQALAGSADPVGCRELGRRLDLNHMRANRLLMTLADIGLAQQDDKRRYTIGPGIHALAAQAMFGSGLLHNALPLLKEIPYTGLVVAIGVLWRDHVTYLLHGIVGNDLDEGIGRVGLHPATRSSVGMMLLSQQDKDDINALFPGRKIPHYDTKKAFNQQLKRSRKDGYTALTMDSDSPHISLAVPIGNPAFAALALSGISPQKKLDPYLNTLTHIASQLEL